MSDKKLTGKGEKVREKMIAATVKILQQEGFKKATVRSIAKEADVNIASVRYYFGSKEELIGCALEYMMGNLENIVAYLDDTRLSAKERLKKYIIAYFHLARQHPALFPLHLQSFQRRCQGYVLHLLVTSAQPVLEQGHPEYR